MTQATLQEISESNIHSAVESEDKPEENLKEEKNYNRQKTVWKNVTMIAIAHLMTIYGIYLIFTSAKIQTSVYAFLLSNFSGFGITAGAHRLWAHRTYKAKWPLRVLLIILNSMAFQFSIYKWVRDHRSHHKFVDTNGDPYNAKRGFFFSHMGWLMCLKHPDVLSKGRSIDMKDLEDDPVVMFQKRYYPWMVTVWAFIVPMAIPMYLWGETLNNALFVGCVFRLFYSEHVTGLVNSAAHYWGNRPYDKYLTPRENPTVAFLALGEGWHNYHHVFPWDYKTSELGNYRANFTTGFIDLFSKIGWAYDLKTVPLKLVYKRAQRTGDNTENKSHPEIWGWGDKDMPKEDIEDFYKYAKTALID